MILPDPEKKSEPPQCLRCPNAPVTTDWQGFVVIMHPDRSEVAKRLNITSPGSYALKVNIR
jgi:DNA-directed RNA polymerase subunit E"